jgi:hypothetical protein
MSFMQDVLTGKSLIGDIDDYIDEWHGGWDSVNEIIIIGTLDEFLGMTIDEYKLFVCDNSNLESIIENRKNKSIMNKDKIPKELQGKIGQDAIHYAQNNASVCEDTTHEALVDGYWEGAKDIYEYLKNQDIHYFMEIVDETASDFATSVGISEARRTELSKQMDGLSKSYANQAIRTCNMFNDILRLCKNIKEVVYCVYVHTSWLFERGYMAYVK